MFESTVSGKRNLKSLEQTVNPCSRYIVVEMKALWPKEDIASGTYVVGTDCVDKNVVKRIQAKEGCDGEDYVAYDLHSSVFCADLDFVFYSYF